MTVCGTDYLSKDIMHKSYVFCYALACYFLPLFVIVYCYFFIVQAVSAHEKGMREQAKKMNVASLRTAENSATSAECKLAKVKYHISFNRFLVLKFVFIF
jgi:r-opsin